MIEVSPDLWVGSGEDCARVRGSLTALFPGVGDWYILTCAKEPWHREALGYTSQAAPKDHPEYLFARRGNRLILNMVDADDPKYFPDAMIDEGLRFIGDALKSGGKVLVHCNQGESRGPGLALLYLLTHGGTIPVIESMEPGIAGAVELFKKIYPSFNPKAGIIGVIERRIFGAQEWSINPTAIEKGHVENPPDEGGDGWLMRMK